MPRADSHVVLRASGLGLELPGREPVTLDLRVSGGEAVQLCGPSGCGKTTLLRKLARLESPGRAAVTLDGRPWAAVAPQVWRRHVCHVAQRPTMLPGTVADNLRAGFNVRHAPRPPADLSRQLRAWMEQLGLAPERVEEQDARTLSGGEAARVALVRVLALGPRVLLCDEPTAALDLEHGRRLAAALGAWLEQGGALVLVAHDPAPWEGLALRRVQVGGGER